MIYILGLIVSCIITGYVYLKILDELYERKYVEKKWIYYLSVIIHILFNVVEALAANPMLNISYSLMALCAGSAFLYTTEKKDVLVNSVIIVIYVAIMDLVVTTIFIGNILVIVNEAGSIKDDMVVNVVFINMGTDHVFIFSFQYFVCKLLP